MGTRDDGTKTRRHNDTSTENLNDYVIYVDQSKDNTYDVLKIKAPTMLHFEKGATKTCLSTITTSHFNSINSEHYEPLLSVYARKESNMR